MSRYLYSLVRCVPDPRTGEFVNIGAIAGEPESADWSVRQVGNESRARKLLQGDSLEPLEAVHGFLARVGLEIDERRLSLEQEGSTEPLGEQWLQALYHDHRNVVQLSPPAPILADTAEQALELLFEQVVIDPVKSPRVKAITKHRILSEIREAYQAAGIPPMLWKQWSEILVGAHVHAPIDFAVGNGTTVQLAQSWSFQRAGLEELIIQVKAWGYALERVRSGESARVLPGDGDGQLSTVSRDVDVEVVVAPPLTEEQTEVYDEAEQVFRGLEAKVSQLDEVATVGERAAALLRNVHG